MTQQDRPAGSKGERVRLGPALSVPAGALADICQRYHVRELAVFGSALRDDFGTESDLDVLVEFAPGAPIGLIELSRLQRELSALVGRQVDVVPKAGLKEAIRQEVLAQAEVVYAAA